MFETKKDYNETEMRTLIELLYGSIAIKEQALSSNIFLWDNLTSRSLFKINFSCFSIVSPEKQVHKISIWAPCKFQRRSHQALNKVQNVSTLVSLFDLRQGHQRGLLIKSIHSHPSHLNSCISGWSIRCTESQLGPPVSFKGDLIKLSIFSECLNSCVFVWS